MLQQQAALCQGHTYQMGQDRHAESMQAALMLQQQVQQQQQQLQQQQQQHQQQQPPMVVRRANPMPVLWTLECIHPDLPALAVERRSLVHCQEPGGPLLATLRVGRLFQEEFFAVVLPSEEARGCVSREHFQIWVDALQGAEDDAHVACGTAASSHGVPCAFFLTNYSKSGTLVNGSHLQKRGEETPLHSGDIIGLAHPAYGSTQEPVGSTPAVLTPLVEFRFSLSGSVLRDADIFGNGEAASNDAGLLNMTQTATLLTSASSKCQAPLSKDAGPPQQLHFGTPPAVRPLPTHGEAMITSMMDGIALVDFAAEPCFALEVCGTAVRDAVPTEQRRILHGPLTAQEMCPALVLGRSLQSGFWESILVEETFGALSRQHLQIEASLEEVSPEGADVSGTLCFYVRNLSERNPIRVTSTVDVGAVENAPPLDRDQRHLLCDGDIITVNPNRGNSVWLVFRDLTTAATGATVARNC